MLLTETTAAVPRKGIQILRTNHLREVATGLINSNNKMVQR